jgi:hypothetical protein
MLVRLLLVMIACGVLAVSRVLIVQGDGGQMPSILSLLPVGYSAGDDAGGGALESPADYGRGGGGITSRSLKSGKPNRFAFFAPASKKHSAAALDALDAQGARGSLRAFRKTLRSQLGVCAGRVRGVGDRVGSRLKSTRNAAFVGVGGLLGRLRSRNCQGRDGQQGKGPGVGVFAERLLRQLVNRAQQTSASLAGAAAGLQSSLGSGGAGVDDRYLDLVRALEVEGHRALGEEEWRPVSVKDDVKLWRRATAEGSYGREYPCLKLSTVLDAPAEAVMALLVDSERVAEYNKYSKGRHDVEHLGPHTKIVRNRSLPPLQKRVHEFCTLMHVVRREDGAQVMLTRFTDHPKVPRSSNYARSEIILGVTEVRPHPTDKGKAVFTTVSHVKSAGVPPFIAEQFSARGLLDFVSSLQGALDRRRGGVRRNAAPADGGGGGGGDSEAALLEEVGGGGRRARQQAQAA